MFAFYLIFQNLKHHVNEILKPTILLAGKSKPSSKCKWD